MHFLILLLTFPYFDTILFILYFIFIVDFEDYPFFVSPVFTFDNDVDQYKVAPVSSGSKSQRPQCSVCNKCFFDASNLRRHMEIHSADRKKFICLLCDKKFSWKTHLFTHLKTSHSVLQPSDKHFTIH